MRSSRPRKRFAKFQLAPGFSNQAQRLVDRALAVVQSFFLQSQKAIEVDAFVMQDGTDLSELKAKSLQPNNLVEPKQLILAVYPPA